MRQAGNMLGCRPEVEKASEDLRAGKEFAPPSLVDDAFQRYFKKLIELMGSLAKVDPWNSIPFLKTCMEHAVVDTLKDTTPKEHQMPCKKRDEDGEEVTPDPPAPPDSDPAVEALAREQAAQRDRQIQQIKEILKNPEAAKLDPREVEDSSAASGLRDRSRLKLPATWTPPPTPSTSRLLTASRRSPRSWDGMSSRRDKP